ncbi:hypothetical protein EDC96DRAFT_526530 [Choanephora cucurbitarum]|nr:hypothetical protein EDC96DRAFT_526530 [Choanephora cucurbitarum]
MSDKKAPIEGLTIRIWDLDNEVEKSDVNNRGSRGYREYTEQIGSDKLKHNVHKFNSDKNVEENQGLKKSTRDWTAEKEKANSVEELSLVSRSDNTNSKQSLKSVELQHELWSLILSKVSQINDDFDPKAWDPIVDLLRKLREGVYASEWSRGDYDFAIKVFELSVDCCIKAGRFEELSKSLLGLMDQLYAIKKEAVQPYYTVLDIIYQCCHTQNPKAANRRITLVSLDTNEGVFGRSLIKSVVNNNPIRYFEHYHYNPYPTFKLLMTKYNDSMRILAIEMLCKAYLSAPIAWVGKWIGIYHDNGEVLKEMERLIQPTCIKSIDYDAQVVYFLKKSKR